MAIGPEERAAILAHSDRARALVAELWGRQQFATAAQIQQLYALVSLLSDDVRVLLAELPGASVYTCPRCGMTSHGRENILKRYCGNCNRFDNTDEV